MVYNIRLHVYLQLLLTLPQILKLNRHRSFITIVTISRLVIASNISFATQLIFLVADLIVSRS